VIDLCQDKYRLSAFLETRGIRVPATCPVSSVDNLEALFDKLPPHAPLWCRLRTGQGGMGAVFVKSPEQARSWIRYWEEMRGIPPTMFTLSEYLPGRDFACQALFKAGRLVLIKSYERLTYLGAGAHPAGFSTLAPLEDRLRAAGRPRSARPRSAPRCGRVGSLLLRHKREPGPASPVSPRSARGVSPEHQHLRHSGTAQYREHVRAGWPSTRPSISWTSTMRWRATTWCATTTPYQPSSADELFEKTEEVWRVSWPRAEPL
jgi:hypothetical protein